jgi:hypothetical protein
LQFDLDGVSGANEYSVNPLALVITVTPPIVAVLRAPAAEGAGPPAPATATPSSTRAATETAAVAARHPETLLQPGQYGAAGRRWPGRLALRGGGKGEHSQRGESGDLDHPGDDPRGRPDLLEPEQADPHRQDVATEGREGKPGAGRGGQPAAGHLHGRGEAEGGDHLEQEKPADRRDGPVAGQVQVEVDRPGHGKQAGPGHPKPEPLSAQSRPPRFLHNH